MNFMTEGHPVETGRKYVNEVICIYIDTHACMWAHMRMHTCRHTQI